MEDLSVVSESLEALSDTGTARRRRKTHRTLRGARGVPIGEVARIAAATWNDRGASLPGDDDALTALFGAAWEDGLVAIGLLGAVIPDAPEEALQLGLEWLERVDDVETADALGWLVLGGALLASGGTLATLPHPDHPLARRAVVMAGLAATPEPIIGPSASPLRERLGTRTVQWVGEALSPMLATHCTRWCRDEAPTARKALRRVLRAWADSDPVALAAWGDGLHGGLPRLLADEVRRAGRRAARRSG